MNLGWSIWKNNSNEKKEHATPFSNIVAKTRELGRKAGNLVQEKIPGGRLLVNDFTKSVVRAALDSTMGYAGVADSRYSNVIDWTEERIVRKPTESVIKYIEAFQNIAHCKDNIYLRLVMRILIENMDSEKLIIYEDFEQFAKIFRFDQDSENQEFERILISLYERYTDFATNNQQALDDQLYIESALKVASKTICDIQAGESLECENFPEILIEAYLSTSNHCNTTEGKNRFCSIVAEKAETNRLSLPTIGAIMIFHEVAMALSSMNLISKNFVIQSCARISKNAVKSLQVGTTKALQLRNNIYETGTHYNDAMKTFIQGQSDWVKLKVREGKDQFSIKLQDLEGNNYLKDAIKIASAYTNQFRSSQEDILKLVTRHKKTTFEFIKSKKSSFISFIKEQNNLPSKSVEKLSKLLDNGTKYYKLSKKIIVEVATLVAAYLVNNKQLLVELMVRIYRREKELLDQGCVVYKDAKIQEVEEAIKFTYYAIKDRSIKIAQESSVLYWIPQNLMKCSGENEEENQLLE